MKNSIALVVASLLMFNLALASETGSVCEKGLYDPSVYGLFKVQNIALGTRTGKGPIKVAVVTITNNYAVPLELSKLVFGVAHEGNYELNSGDWNVAISHAFAHVYKDTDNLSEAMTNIQNDSDVVDGYVSRALTTLAFGLDGKASIVPPETSRHFALFAAVPDHVLATKLSVLMSHMVIRPAWPDECVAQKKAWGDEEIMFIPPGIPSFAQLRELAMRE